MVRLMLKHVQRTVLPATHAWVVYTLVPVKGWGFRFPLLVGRAESEELLDPSQY